MASNKPLLIITALCLMVPASLWAQNTESHFVQRLTWVGDEYATRYEVIIEKEEDGKYKRVLREFTTAFFIEVSLSHGKYRYQVIPYDFFNLPVPVKEWMEFEVQRGVINPEEPESKNEIIIQSPEPETVTENKKPFDIYMGLAWIPIVPIYGWNNLFGENLSPYGACLRLAIVSAKQKTLNFGMEGSSSWRFSMGDQPAHSLTFDLNVVLRFSDDKAALNCKTGAGVSLGIGASPVLSAGHANIGVSFLFLPLKHLYLEAGMDYVQFFTNSGSLCPSFGLGYKF
jgi:hypothetical protein